MKSPSKKHESEDRIQIKFMNWMRKHARKDPRYLCAHHVPNGGKRGRREASNFKLMGVVAGIPDVSIPVPNETYHGLYIEFKTVIGRVSDVQKEIHKVIRGNGYFVAVCRSMEEAIQVVEDYEGNLL